MVGSPGVTLVRSSTEWVRVAGGFTFQDLLVRSTSGVLPMRLSYAVVAASLLTVGSASVSQAQSLAGDWDAFYNSPGGGKIAFKLALKVDAGKLTGTVKRSAGESPLTGTVKGDSVNFSYSIKYGDNDLVVTILAKVTGGTEMTGTADFAGQVQEAFGAKKISAGAAPDVKYPGIGAPR